MGMPDSFPLLTFRLALVIFTGAVLFEVTALVDFVALDTWEWFEKLLFQQIYTIIGSVLFVFSASLTSKIEVDGHFACLPRKLWFWSGFSFAIGSVLFVVSSIVILLNVTPEADQWNMACSLVGSCAYAIGSLVMLIQCHQE